MIEILFFAFVVLQGIDFLTTTKALRMGLTEGNPLLVRLFKAMPAEKGLLLVKLASVVLIGGLLLFGLVAEITLSILVLVYLGIAANNIYRIKRHGD